MVALSSVASSSSVAAVVAESAAVGCALDCAMVGTAVAVPLVPPPVAPPSPALSTAPQVLSASDVALYKQIMSAMRAGQQTKAQALIARLSDTSLAGYAEAQYFLSAAPSKVSRSGCRTKGRRNPAAKRPQSNARILIAMPGRFP